MHLYSHPPMCCPVSRPMSAVFFSPPPPSIINSMLSLCLPTCQGVSDTQHTPSHLPSVTPSSTPPVGRDENAGEARWRRRGGGVQITKTIANAADDDDFHDQKDPASFSHSLRCVLSLHNKVINESRVRARGFELIK